MLQIRREHQWPPILKLLQFYFHSSRIMVTDNLQQIKQFINFNSRYYMLSRLLKQVVCRISTKVFTYHYPQFTFACSYRSMNRFSVQKQITISEVAAQNIDTKTSTNVIDGEEVELVQTKGAISILDRVPGVKADNGQMYILSFCCTKCQTKSIRSFTKHAYHNGVVMVRCGGCQNIHLVADNLGWFEDKPVNVETMHPGKIHKIHDQAAIASFLQAAFAADAPQSSNESKASPDKQLPLSK